MHAAAEHAAGNAEENSEANTEQSRAWYNEQRLLYFGIPVQVRFRHPDPEPERTRVLAQKAWAYLERIDTHFNDYQADSEIARINAINQDEAAVVQISEQMRQVLQQAQSLHVLSAGAFDITLGPLRRLWKEAAAQKQFPSEAAIREAQRQTGMQHLYIEGDRLSVLQAGLCLDVGGMIKGFAVDSVMEMLIEAGVEDALVQVGGETACMGLSQRGKAHVFAVPDPRKPEQAIQIIQDPGTGYSGCTSGNYRQPIIIDGKPYYHIFDPRTGMPSTCRVLSVSVVFPETGRNALADALATAGVVMGAEKILPLVHALGGACLVYMQDGEDMQAYASERWGDYVYQE